MNIGKLYTGREGGKLNGNGVTMLWSLLYPLQSYIRSIPSSRRKLHRKHKYVFIKKCASHDKARQEFDLMTKIKTLKPICFTLPEPISLINRGDKAYLLTKYIKAHDLTCYVERFLWNRDHRLLDIFFKVGQGLRELSELKLGLPSSSVYLFSKAKLLRETEEISTKLFYYNFLTSSQAQSLIWLLENENVDSLLKYVNLHGGLYPSNILISDIGDPIFLDFETIFRGPRYVDLMILLGSMCSSAFISLNDHKQINLVTEKFIEGYGEGELKSNSLRPFLILYMLWEIWGHLCFRCRGRSLHLKVINSIKLNVLRRKIQALLKLYGIENFDH